MLRFSAKKKLFIERLKIPLQSNKCSIKHLVQCRKKKQFEITFKIYNPHSSRKSHTCEAAADWSGEVFGSAHVTVGVIPSSLKPTLDIFCREKSAHALL